MQQHLVGPGSSKRIDSIDHCRDDTTPLSSGSRLLYAAYAMHGQISSPQYCSALVATAVVQCGDQQYPQPVLMGLPG